MLIAIGATARLDAEHERRLDQGAARTLYFELGANYESLQEVDRGAARAPIFTQVWREQQTRIAMALGPADFGKVAMVYNQLEAIRLRAELNPDSPMRIIDHDEDVLSQLATEILHGPVMPMLRDVGWDGSEQDELTP